MDKPLTTSPKPIINCLFTCPVIQRLSLRIILFLLCVFALNLRAEQSAEYTQVLLIGPDSDALVAALAQHGGEVTHRLPIIDAIGGQVPTTNITQLIAAPGVSRVIEDKTPTETPEPRACAIAGDLDISIHPSSLEWRIHNFATKSQHIQSITVDWPANLEPPSLLIETPNKRHALGTPTRGAALKTDIKLPPGPSTVRLASPSITHALQQNDLTISLGLQDCEASLPRAYENNHESFHFPTLVSANLLHSAALTGSGIGVAIIDSGLWDNPVLTLDSQGQKRVVAHYNAITHEEHGPLEDLGGHGSHMASIIANSQRSSEPASYKGIAPDSHLIPITAFEPSGDADFLNIIRGLQWVLDHHKQHNIRVVNMSLSATPGFSYWDDPINRAVFKLWQEGLLVVAAAGNDGPDWGTIGSPGNNPYVLTVGAMTDSWTPADTTDDYIPDFSSRGPTPEGHIKPDLVAPGGHMTGLIPPNSRLYRENPNYVLKTGEFVSTGSSQAAAVVSGIAALLLQARPELTNDQLKCLLVTSAKPAINRDGRLSYSPLIQGQGLVDAARALTVGVTQCEQDNLNINQAVAGKEQLVGPIVADERGDPLIPHLKALISTQTAEKGASSNRRWGVHAHLGRLDPSKDQSQAQSVPVDWAAIFAAEQKKVTSLSSKDD